MKKSILIASALICTIQGTVYAGTSGDQEEVKTSIVTQDVSRSTPPTDKIEIERRGCCSHHGGVCGCENGRAKCCDGTLSPTCGC